MDMNNTDQIAAIAKEFQCDCEVCAHSAAICPATAEMNENWRRELAERDNRKPNSASTGNVARADAEFVLRWLKQMGSPENIIGLQERIVSTLSAMSETREKEQG